MPHTVLLGPFCSMPAAAGPPACRTQYCSHAALAPALCLLAGAGFGQHNAATIRELLDRMPPIVLNMGDLNFFDFDEVVICIAA